MQYGFYFDADRCGSCKACVMACRDKNDTLLSLKNRNVIDFGGGRWVEKDGLVQPENVFVYSISISCNHCESPACVANCPTGAMIKRDEDGIVYVDESVCIGCGTCANACPYGAPKVRRARRDEQVQFLHGLPRRGRTPRLRGCLPHALPRLRRHCRAAREVWRRMRCGPAALL
jgi:DMSO reductase iron-sulfur subunit